MYSIIIKGIYNGAFNYTEFVCDYVSDIDSLPTNTAVGYSNGKEISTCAIGSKAKVLENSQEYVLNNSNNWVLYFNHSVSPFPNSQFDVTDDSDGNVKILEK